MQNFANNWSATVALAMGATSLAVALPPGTFKITLSDSLGLDATRWEIVVAEVVAGVATLTRGQEGTSDQDWPDGSVAYIAVTAGFLEELQDPATAGVDSFNGRTGAVSLTGTDVTEALGFTPANSGALATVASTGSYTDLVDTPSIPESPGDIGAATASQGALADSAVQPADLAAVATSGSYNDLSDTPAAAIPLTQKGAASGVATLDASSKIPLSQLPATAITEASVVASEAAMLALTAQAGDVAIRTDISTSFILMSEPASTLGNWQEILAPASGGGAPVGSAVPQALGTATPGVSTSASRQDHVHQMPSAADVGADPAGTGAAAVAAHAGTGGSSHAAVVSGGASGFMTGAQAQKLDGVAAGATANDTDANLRNRATHTGQQATSTVTGLDAALAARALIAGLPSRTVTASGAVTPADAGHWLICNSATPITLTIGAEATAAWAVSGILPMFHVLQIGAGAVTVTGDGFSVTVHASDTNVLGGAGAAATALRRSSNTWNLIGRLVAA